ncbi:glycoside hydrolase family 32 protein [Paenibacillus whitsoniae]|uniref:Sucrose-6-phosphate hydrolase n=1 Tax=Paenibacillus whitsoniae TaxID=2496558 RepID=A0A3S0BVB1_9BACL|nr:glycoside hydrolase family 32 protein [Paenibacillus whitsoniae]RTE09155.1 glycoside hydrolase family 32 protein [Paenibacillus whitsoniae]
MKDKVKHYTRENADTYIGENKQNIRLDYRLQYHLMSEYGWMNDPNGFVFFKENFHLFYQHYPYTSYWGPMHWGHAISRDLIKWTYLPVALAPDQSYDESGCFSGSAIEKDGKLFLMYTGHVVTGPDKDNDYIQTQNLAVSDEGVRFEKIQQNPVIPVSLIPTSASQKDFRDPKVFERDGKYYAVIGSNDNSKNGIILLYRSEDLQHWTFVNEIARSDGHMGDNWECPDLFQLDHQDVLVVSPQRMPSQGYDYHNIHSTVSMLGRLDTEQGKFHYNDYKPMDYGFDYYAPQTCEDNQGRRIVIAWMETWEIAIPTQEGHHWAGAMTLPREMRIVNDKIVYRPVEEIKTYRSELYELKDVLLSGEQRLECTGDSYELDVVFDAFEAEEFGLKLRVHEKEETLISYRVDDNLLRFNRDQSGIGPKGERLTKVPLNNNQLVLRIFVDRSSVEIFIQDGEKVMTGRIYPGTESLGIHVFSQGKCRIVSLNKWDIL